MEARIRRATAFLHLSVLLQSVRCHLPWQETGRGLSGIVEGQLGMSLDKGLQCSSWGLRPLSPEQLHYAALDAAVLLMLLDSIIAAALPSRVVPSPLSHEDPQIRPSSAGGTGQAGTDLDASLNADSSLTGVHSHRELTLLGSTADAGLEQPDASDSALTGRKTAQSDQGCWQGGLQEHQSSACKTSSTATAEEALQQLSLCSIGSNDAGDANGCKSAREEQRASSAADIRCQGACQDGGVEQRARQAAGMQCVSSMLVPRAASAEELQEAAQLWGSRLELGGACRQGALKLSRERQLGVRARLGQEAESEECLGEERWL